MLRSDAHHDNIYCNRELEREHLEKAKKRGALIVDAGDLFCAMQGKWDPRSSYDALREEDKSENYLDLIVDHAAEDYAPYAENFLSIGHGNHETNIRNRHGTDLSSNLVRELNRSGGNVFMGYYGGWVRFQFKVHKTKSFIRNLKYYHGKSTQAPVTKGVIQTARQAVYLPDADIVLNGHNHESYIVPIKRERLTHKGNVDHDVCYFARTPGYKDEYADGAKGFAVEKGTGPKPIGCAWVRFYLKRGRGVGVDFDLMMDIE